MVIKQVLRSALLGTDRIPSRQEYKFAMLRGEFAILIILVALFYTVLDLINDMRSFLPWYGLMIAIGITVILLNRRGYYKVASYFILIPINVVIFLFADVDHPQGGVYFFFLCASVAGMVLLSSQSRTLQLIFGILPILLGFIARLWDFNIIDYPSRDETIVMVNFLANFAIGLLTSIMIIAFMINRHRESERSLLSSEYAMIKASEKLKRSEERYALALKGRQAGIYEWFVAENRVELSDHWKNLLGYKADEIGFITLDIFLDMVHAGDLARTSASVERHMAEQTPYENELRLRMKDGTYRWFQDTGIAKTDSDGRLQVVIGAIIDIHDRKLAEEKILTQNELLAKANKELDHFVYSVSHDLRAPLSSILGLTHIYTLAKDQQERDHIVSMVNDRAQVLDRFIREVLDYSRNTRLELHMQPVIVADVIKELLNGLDHMDGIEHVRIQADLDKEVSIVTDRERLKVILSNLLANAVHYRDPSKKSFVHIRGSVIDNMLELDIEDNGIGIRKEHQERIFEMFYKAHDHSEGTGLGLYIVMETVQRMKGSIEVRSEYTLGTTFRLKLPDNRGASLPGNAHLTESRSTALS